MTGSWDLAKQSPCRGRELLLSKAFPGPGLASENDPDSATVEQAGGGPAKGQDYFNTSLVSEFQFSSSLLSYTSHQLSNAKSAALVVSQEGEGC